MGTPAALYRTPRNLRGDPPGDRRPGLRPPRTAAHPAPDEHRTHPRPQRRLLITHQPNHQASTSRPHFPPRSLTTSHCARPATGSVSWRSRSSRSSGAGSGHGPVRVIRRRGRAQLAEAPVDDCAANSGASVWVWSCCYDHWNSPTSRYDTNAQGVRRRCVAVGASPTRSPPVARGTESIAMPSKGQLSC